MRLLAVQLVVSAALRGALAAGLVFLPGSWIAFSPLGGDLPRRVRWALAVALSPFVLAVQVSFTSWLGLSFADAIPLLALLDLAALPLILRSHTLRREAAAEATDRAALLSCLGVVILSVAPLWLVPLFRTYGWHNLMQLAVSYQIAGLPVVPEEMDMAGIRQSYPWLGLIHVTALSWLLDRSPTSIFPASNVAMLASLCVLLHATGRSLAGRPSRSVAIGTAVVLLGSNAIGMAGWLLTRSPWAVGDSRFTPLTAKFLFFDAMTVALPVVAGLFTVSVHLLESRRDARGLALVPVLVLAVGVTYPLLFPPTLLAAGLLAALLLQERVIAVPRYPLRATLALCAGLGAAGGLALVYLHFLGGGRSASVLDFGWRRALFDAAKLPFAIGIPALLALPVVRRGWARRDPALLFACGSAALAVGLFVISRYPVSVEYKYLFPACFSLVPLGALGLAEWLERRPGRALASGGALLAGVFALAVGSSYAFHVPWHELAGAPELDEASFQIGARDGSEPAWIEALRATPERSVLVVDATRLPIPLLARRASFLSSNFVDDSAAGYAMPFEAVLTEVKGYSRSEFERRRGILAACFGASSARAFEPVTEAFLALKRPVVIAFPRAEPPYLQWLRSHGPGREVYRGEAGSVWRIDAADGPDAPGRG